MFPKVDPEALYRDPKWHEGWHGDMICPSFSDTMSGKERVACAACSLCSGREEAKARIFYFILLVPNPDY